MALAFNKQKLSDGVNFTSITDTRFKTNFIAINLITELNADTATANAIIPSVLSRSNSTYKTITEINKKLIALYGASINGDVSKMGDSQCVTMSASCIADTYTFNGEKITADLTDILLECLLSPNVENGEFSQKNFELNKLELIDDIDAEINEKRSYAVICASKRIFDGESAAITSHGDKEHAVALNPKASYEQYKILLKTSQIEIFFVGGGNPNDVKEKFEKAFKCLDREFKGFAKSAKSKLKSTICEATDTLDVAQSKMVMAFKTEDANIPSVKLMNSIFGQTPFSKLFTNVREKLSLCYYCSSGYEERKGVLIVDSGVEHENIEKARVEIINQLNEVSSGNFTEEETNNSLLSLINNHKAVNDSPYALANWYLRQAYNGTTFTPEQEIDRIKSVTRDDIITAAKSFKLDTVYVLTKKGGDK